MDMNRFNAHLSSPQTIADVMTFSRAIAVFLHKMKRLDCCCTDPPPKRRAAVVPLNVGGKSFDTTHDTLAKASYFLPYLEGQFIAMYQHTTTTALRPPIVSPISFQGRLEHSVDDQGRLFIDRDPQLFAVVLQFMRASTTPPQSLIRANRESLLEECRFSVSYTHLTLPTSDLV